MWTSMNQFLWGAIVGFFIGMMIVSLLYEA